MSKQIDVLTHKLTQEERDYLESRGRRHLILENDRRFPDSSSAPQRTNQSEDEDWEDQVNELTVAELRDELTSRGLSASGNKDELRARLIGAGPDDEED